jgi:hypothetical protein
MVTDLPMRATRGINTPVLRVDTVRCCLLGDPLLPVILLLLLLLLAPDTDRDKPSCPTVWPPADTLSVFCCSRLEAAVAGGGGGVLALAAAAAAAEVLYVLLRLLLLLLLLD